MTKLDTTQDVRTASGASVAHDYARALGQLEVQLEAAEQRLTEARVLLRDIEWAGDTMAWVCPACRRDRSHGHTAQCPLMRALTD